jgi:hypothetical protein
MHTSSFNKIALVKSLMTSILPHLNPSLTSISETVHRVVHSFLGMFSSPRVEDPLYNRCAGMLS